MTGQVVHHHDVADPQLWQKHFFDIGFEDDTVDWSVNDEGRNETTQRQRSDESGCFPVTMGNTDAQAFSPCAPTMATRHVCRCPCLVYENKACWIEVKLTVEPVLAALQDVGTALFASVRSLFFARDLVARKKALDRAKTKEQTLFGKALPDFFDSCVFVWPESFEDDALVGINAGRAPVSAERTRPSITLLAFTLAPATDTGRAHPETFGCSPMR